MKKLKISDLKVKSFVTDKQKLSGGHEIISELPIDPTPNFQCSWIDACPSAWVCSFPNECIGTELAFCIFM